MQRTPAREPTAALASGPPTAGGPGTAGRWARFLAGSVALLLLAFGVIPAVQRIGPAREVRDAIHRRGIDASALIYTESDVSFEAEASLRDALRFSPNGSKVRRGTSEERLR